MVESPTVEELEQSIRDAQEKFNVGMGADGDASPYPLLKQLRAQAPVHPGCMQPYCTVIWYTVRYSLYSTLTSTSTTTTTA